MDVPNDQSRMADLGWDRLAERCWVELVDRGFPHQLAELSGDLAESTRRPVRLLSMPMIDVGVGGVAVPFMKEDWILFDPALLRLADELTCVVTRELAHLFYPGWRELRSEAYDEMEEFCSDLAALFWRRLPHRLGEARPLVNLAMLRCRAA